MTRPTSSATSNAPARSTTTPTGRPKASLSSLRKPLKTSAGFPAGRPSANGTWTTLYPLLGMRFHEPCSPIKAPPRYFSGRRSTSGKRQSQRSVVIAKRVVENDRFRHKLSMRRLNSIIYILAQGIDLQSASATFLFIKPVLASVAVRAHAYIETGSVGARDQTLGPMMIEGSSREVGDLDAGSGYLCGTIGVEEAQDRVC